MTEVEAGLVCPEKTCARPVRQVTLTSGATLLIDPAPHSNGCVVADVDDRYRVLPGSLLPAEQAAWRPHAQTCLADLRNRRRAWVAAPATPRDEGPSCRVCRLPLDGVLSRAGATTHPSCDGTEG